MRTLTLIVALLLAPFTLEGCAGTCDRITMERHPHPTQPAPAKRIVAKCGRATTTMDVDEVPACLNRCFDGGGE